MDFLPFLVGADGWMDGWVTQITNLWLYQETKRSVFFFFFELLT